MSNTELEVVEAMDVDEDFEMHLALDISLSAVELDHGHLDFPDLLECSSFCKTDFWVSG